MVPQSVSRTFPLLQFADWVGRGAAVTQRVAPGDAIVRQALDGRGQAQPMPQHEQDIADPLGRSYRRFLACADQTYAAIRAVLSPLEVQPASQPAR